jgi:hypothetical protein
MVCLKRAFQFRPEPSPAPGFLEPDFAGGRTKDEDMDNSFREEPRRQGTILLRFPVDTDLSNRRMQSYF